MFLKTPIYVLYWRYRNKIQLLTISDLLEVKLRILLSSKLRNKSMITAIILYISLITSEAMCHHRMAGLIDI